MLGRFGTHVAVTDLSPLRRLPALTLFQYDGGPITDLAELDRQIDLSRLTTLVLRNTQVSDLAPLAGIAGLTT